MKTTNPAPFLEQLSGAVSSGLSKSLDEQAPVLATAKKYQQQYLSERFVPSYGRVIIADDMYQLVTRLVAAVGKNKTSVGAYVTEIVRDHVKRNMESINAVYLLNTQPLF